MHRPLPSLPAPQSTMAFPVQIEPIAARLIAGAKTVVIETALALNVAFGPDRAAALASAAAASFATVSPLTTAHFQVPEGAEFIALALAADSPQAASIAARDGARVVALTTH